MDLTALKAIILTIIGALPPTYSEIELETPAQRQSRLEPFAEVVASYERPEDQAALLTISYGESTLAWYVRDNCTWRPPKSVGDCDKGKSRSYFQLKEATCRELWDPTLKHDSKRALKVAAQCAIRHYHFSKRTCGSPILAFAKYGGRGCRDFTKRTDQKARLYRSILAKIYAARAKHEKELDTHNE